MTDRGWGDSLDGLGAELAAGCGDGDVADAVGAGLGSGRYFYGWVEAFEEVLRGQHEEEVDHAGDEQEVDDGGNEGAVLDLAAVGVGDEVVEVRLADDGAEQWVNDVCGEGGDDGCERRADNDGDGEIHDVAAQNEVAKSLEHDDLLELQFPASIAQGVGGVAMRLGGGD